MSLELWVRYEVADGPCELIVGCEEQSRTAAQVELAFTYYDNDTGTCLCRRDSGSSSYSQNWLSEPEGGQDSGIESCSCVTKILHKNWNTCTSAMVQHNDDPPISPVLAASQSNWSNITFMFRDYLYSLVEIKDVDISVASSNFSSAKR